MTKMEDLQATVKMYTASVQYWRDRADHHRQCLKEAKQVFRLHLRHLRASARACDNGARHWQSRLVASEQQLAALQEASK